MLIMGAVSLYLLASGKPSPRTTPDLDLDAALTEEIYAAARAAGLNPEGEMRSLSESCIYPIAIIRPLDEALGDQGVLMTLLNGYEHYERCMCAECQVDRLPPEKRTNIFVEADAYGNIGPIAHANSCVCDKCRSELGIDAEKALAFLLTQSSSTTSLSDTGMSARSIEYLERWKTTTPLRLN